MLVDGRIVPRYTIVLEGISLSPSKSKGQSVSLRSGVVEGLASRPGSGLEIQSGAAKRDCWRGRSAALFREAFSGSESKALARS